MFPNRLQWPALGRVERLRVLRGIGELAQRAWRRLRVTALLFLVQRSVRLSGRILPLDLRPRVVFVDIPGIDDARALFGSEYGPECFVDAGYNLDLSEIIAVRDAELIVSTGGAVYRDLNPRARRIELWHASGAVKRVANYTYRDVTSDYVVCCPSEPLRHAYGEAFGASIDRVVASGAPRTDILMDQARLATLRDEFMTRHPDLVGSRLYVYFPTFRGTWPYNVDFDPKISLPGLASELRPDEVLLVKLHPILRHSVWLSRGLTPGAPVRDVSAEDTTSLLEVADVVIVDYSSVLFDAVLLDKPIVAYAEDVDEYSRARGFAFDYRGEIPFALIEDPDPAQLLAAIRDSKLVSGWRMDQFRARYLGACDGLAQGRVRGLILGLLEGRAAWRE